jgi:hypothetical protein
LDGQEIKATNDQLRSRIINQMEVCHGFNVKSRRGAKPTDSVVRNQESERLNQLVCWKWAVGSEQQKEDEMMKNVINSEPRQPTTLRQLDCPACLE